jgi:hypothetical protein
MGNFKQTYQSMPATPIISSALSELAFMPVRFKFRRRLAEHDAGKMALL